MATSPRKRRTAPVVQVTHDQIRADWNALFDKHPWLDGLTCTNHCANVFCCPPDDLPDWGALSQASGLLWLAGGPATATTLTRDALPDEMPEILR